MIHQIADFINGIRVIAILRGENHLRGLLADFLEDLVDSLFKQIRRVAAFLRLRLTPAQHLKEIVILKRGRLLAFEHGLKEAALCAGVAGGARLFDLDEQRVRVAIRRDGHDLLRVSACFALSPEFLPRAGPEAGPALRHRNAEALRVHIREHEHVLCFGIDHDCGDQPLIVEFEC